MIIPAASTGAIVPPAHTARISDFGLASDITISRRIEGGPYPFVRAQLVAKSDAADSDANAVVLKSISPIATSSGQITDTGASTGVAAIQFELAPIETAQLTTTSYYAIAATDSAGNIYILERGILTAAVPTVELDARVAPNAPWSLVTTSPEPPRGGRRELLREMIADVQQGEDYTLSRWIRGQPVGWSVISLLFTIRRAGTDPDAAAVVQKNVSLTHDLTFPVAVSLTKADTALLIGPMVWDAKLTIWNGALSKTYTVAVGTMFAQGAAPLVRFTPAKVSTMSIAAIGVVTALPTQLTLTMTGTDGTAINPRAREVKWGSQNKAVALVSPTGLVTGVAAGSTDIVASCEGVATRATITVQAAVASITVTPNPLSNLVIGSPQLLTVVLRDAGGNVLTGRAISFVSSDPTKVTVTSSGVATSISGGTTNIVVSSEGVTTSIPVTIPNAVSSVTLSPSPVSLTTGSTQQLTATLRDSLSNILTGRVIAWLSSNPGVATVSSTGLVTGVSAGTTNVTATSESVSSAADVVTDTVPLAAYGIVTAPAAWWKGSDYTISTAIACAAGSGFSLTLGSATAWPGKDTTDFTTGAIHFNSGGQWLTNTGFNLLNGVLVWTLFVVFKANSPTNGVYVWPHNTAGDFQQQTASGTYVYGSSGNYGNYTGGVDTAKHVHEAVFDGTQTGNAARLLALLDGTAKTLSFTGTIPAAAGTANGIDVGSAAGAGNVPTGTKIAEILFYTTALSSTDRSTVRHALGTRHSITVS